MMVVDSSLNKDGLSRIPRILRMFWRSISSTLNPVVRARAECRQTSFLLAKFQHLHRTI